MPAVLSVAIGFLAGASAFQAGANIAPRSAVARSAVSMQVSEATVASPVALAKVRDSPLCRLLAILRSPSGCGTRPRFVQRARSRGRSWCIADGVCSVQAADEARGLAIDSISKAKSGHMGLPLGCAEIGACLYGQLMCAAAPPFLLPAWAWLWAGLRGCIAFSSRDGHRQCAPRARAAAAVAACAPV